MRSLLKSCVVLLSLSASLDSFAQFYPPAQVQPPPATQRQYGNAAQAPGSIQTYQRYGNTSYGANGETYQHYGNTAYGSNGQIYQQSGNSIYGSNGETSRQVGSSGVGSNRRICQTFGNVTYCQ
jgi:hypothetical protein